MPSQRKFFVTKVVVTVLSEDVPPEFDNLSELHDLIGNECSGQYSVETSEAVDGVAMAKLLVEQASDPELFRLTAEGEDLS